MLEQHIVELPKSTLLAGTLGGLVGLVGAVTVAQNRIKDQPDLARFDVILANEGFGT